MRRLLAVALVGCLSIPASAGDAECMFQMGGQDVLIGSCVATDEDATGSVTIRSPDGKVAAQVVGKGGGVGEAFWNGGAGAEGTEVRIGSVVLIGACWSSDKTKLCVTR